MKNKIAEPSEFGHRHRNGAEFSLVFERELVDCFLKSQEIKFGPMNNT